MQEISSAASNDLHLADSSHKKTAQRRANVYLPNVLACDFMVSRCLNSVDRMRTLLQSDLACFTHTTLRTVTYVKLKTWSKTRNLGNAVPERQLCRSWLPRPAVHCTQREACSSLVKNFKLAPAFQCTLSDCEGCVITLMSVLPEVARRIIRRTGGLIFNGYVAMSANFGVPQTS